MQQQRPAPAAAADAPSRRLKLLALHSFRTSGAIFKDQLRRSKWLGEVFTPSYDLVFVDAPNPASGQIPKDVAPFFAGPYYEWLTVERHGDKLFFDEEKLERSLGLVVSTLRQHAAEQQPFDGVVGFSQGTAMASAIVALQAAGMALQDVPPLKFCILFAGFQSQYPPHMDAWKSKVKVPSLHVFGDRDMLRPQCKELADAFENPVVLQHTRGHSIPQLTPVHLAVVRAFLASVAQEPAATDGGLAGLQRAPTSAVLALDQGRAGGSANGNGSVSGSEEDLPAQQQEGWPGVALKARL